MTIGVLLVDDSAVMRQTLGGVLQKAPGITLLGAVSDPILAMARMQQQWPDVIVLDVEMPRMDGITFLKKIMQERPTPVVICSTLTEQGAQTTIDAMAAGAFTAIAKPRLGLRNFLDEHAKDFIATIRAAAQADGKRLLPRKPAPSLPVTEKLTADVVVPPIKSKHALSETTERIVAIGTSTGGTQALEQILTALPRLSPGIVIVQHMPEKFTAAFAQRLNTLCAIEVKEAQNGDRVLPGRALIAPGGRHMVLRRSGAQYTVEVLDGPLVSRHRPSVNVLFRSVAQAAGRNAMGILLTGMGDDGAVGLLEMRQVGAHTLAQDEASSVVFGMPKEAIKRGAAAEVIALGNIHQKISQYRNT